MVCLDYIPSIPKLLQNPLPLSTHPTLCSLLFSTNHVQLALPMEAWLCGLSAGVWLKQP